MADNDGAVHYLTAPTPNFGLAKWSALQATEKALKGFSQILTGQHRRGHNLSLVAAEAAAAGLPAEVNEHLPTIQCDASVRYGEIPVTRSEALAAHHASLQVMRIIGRKLHEREAAS